MVVSCMQLGDGFCGRRDEADQFTRQEGEAHVVVREDLRKKVLPLFGKWMRIDDAHASLKTGAPHANTSGTLGSTPGTEVPQRCKLEPAAMVARKYKPISWKFRPSRQKKFSITYSSSSQTTSH